LITSSPCALAENSTKITQSDNGKIRAFQVGDKIEIVLPATLSLDLGLTGNPIVTGGQWVETRDGNGDLPSFHSKVIKPVTLKLPTVGDNNQVLTYEVIGKGKAELSLNYRDSKSKNLILDTFTTVIAVE
jgi:hypothetical protein